MKSLIHNLKTKPWLEEFLIYSIILFVVISLIFFIFIVLRQSHTRTKEERAKRLMPTIEQMLTAIIFGKVDFDILNADPKYARLLKRASFRSELMNSVINLHQNYEGTYALLLEEFYKKSGLLDDSMKKLRFSQWQVKCKGIKELAEMKITSAFETLATLAGSRNLIVSINAIDACIELNTEKGILLLSRYNYPINRWTQINFIHTFQQSNTMDEKTIGNLLYSPNNSVISLGLKVVQTLGLSHDLPFVTRLIESHPDPDIRLEAQIVKNKLLTYNYSPYEI